MNKELIKTMKTGLLIGSLMVNVLFGYIIHLYTQDDKEDIRVKYCRQKEINNGRIAKIQRN